MKPSTKIRRNVARGLLRKAQYFDTLADDLLGSGKYNQETDAQRLRDWVIDRDRAREIAEEVYKGRIKGFSLRPSTKAADQTHKPETKPTEIDRPTRQALAAKLHRRHKKQRAAAMAELREAAGARR